MSIDTESVSLEVLRTLHRIHRQLSDLKARNDRGPRQIRAAEANVKMREETLAKVKEELKEMRKSSDQKNLQLKTSEQKILDLKTKLNGAASNKEYQILKDQIAADTMAKSVLEDEILEAMESVENFLPKITEEESNLKMSRERHTKVQAEVAEQIAAIRTDITRLEAELKTNEAELPESIRDIYTRLVRGKGEDGMAGVVEGACGGCYQQVPLNILADIRMSHPSFCKTCGRLLYLGDDYMPPKADAAPYSRHSSFSRVRLRRASSASQANAAKLSSERHQLTYRPLAARDHWPQSDPVLRGRSSCRHSLHLGTPYHPY